MNSSQKYLIDLASLFSPTSSEYSYRTPFENYLREIFPESEGYRIKHEDKTGDGNKPDFMVAKKNGDTIIPILYIEVKDIGKNLDTIEKSNQASRYFWYDNLIIADYLEFRFYRYGQAYETPILLGHSDRKNWKISQAWWDNATMLERRMRDFVSTGKERIKSASHLAKIMGGKAQRVRDNLREMMQNTEKYPDIWKLYHTFKSEILHDLSHDDFADLYAQTLVYGLFVARYHDQTPETFSRVEARDLVPKSNPLLRRFFDHIAGEGYEKRLEYIVDELCEVFAHADVHALMHGMYQKETHDPVIHFYEDFLGEYDSDLRMQRWVFYTPAPVVKFIIRAIDDVLKTHFGLSKWLADTSKIKVEREIQKYDKKWDRKTEMIETHRVQILDPATGTGTFLDEIVRHVHSKMSGQAGMWQSYVNADLLPRLHGFELMMASYTIAHLKLWLTLAETGVTNIEKRLQIYLTNSLDEAKTTKEDQGTLFGLLESITDEARQADEVKQDKPVMIVVGNPPYSVSSTNKSPWIEELMKDYKKNLNERNIQPLSDDYIKFIRFGESLIEKNGEWILAYISNNSFIDGIIHRQMRQHLRETFDSIYILNLHGDARKQEKSPNGSKDENVFDIMQWVSIGIFVKTKNPTKRWIFHYDLYGKRQEKYDFLEKMNFGEIQWNNLSLANHGYFRNLNEDWIWIYNLWFKLDNLFLKSSSAIKTHRDDFTVDFTSQNLLNNFSDFYNLTLSESFLRDKYKLSDNRDWSIENARRNKWDSFEQTLNAYHFRCFDYRYILYSDNLIDYWRRDIMSNILHWSIWLVTAKTSKSSNSWDKIFITNKIVDIHNIGDQSYCFPLYLYSDSETLEWMAKTPNLDATIWAKISESVGRETSPEEVLDYIYAVLHSPKYREKYREFLKIDFPRVPYPKDRASFESLVKLGGELRGLHLLESPKVEEYITIFPVPGNGEVEKVSYVERRVYINSLQYFGDVPEVAWNFYIGGYQPAQKWLKDRKWRTLTWEDIAHYQSMIVALTETNRVMEEVDRVYGIAFEEATIIEGET